MIFADAFRGAGVDAFDALVYGAEGAATGQTPFSHCADLGGQPAVADLSGPVQRSRCPTAHFTQEGEIHHARPSIS